MLGLRRFRAFLLLVLFTATAVYYIARTKRLSIPDIDRLRNTYLDHGSSKNQQLDHNIEIPPPPGDAFGAAAPERVPTSIPNRIPTATTDHDIPEQVDTSLPHVPTPFSQEETTALPDQERLPDHKEVPEKEKTQKPQENSQTAVDGSGLLRWRKQKEQNPIADDDLITLPLGRPLQLPRIQHDFEPETAAEKANRIKKQDVIRKSFEHAWNGYKKHALPHDELKPVSKDYADRKQFMGWGATLVDTLDTLWIMGLHDDFEEAVKLIEKIDFKSSTSTHIPLFETVIRYLGGLISAYDLTSKRHPVLLDKAVELADVLMGAFDTPNRMPVPFFEWSSIDADKPRRSHANTVLAEIGSMTMEFTRLAQLTGENKYYDAVARVTDSLEKFQPNTEMPGLWPLRLDSSGCKKSKLTSISKGSPKEKMVRPVSTIPIDTVQDDVSEEDEPAVPPAAKDASTETKIRYDSVPYFKRALDDHLTGGSKLKTTVPECDLQDLVHEPDATITFGIGGQADSVYEYMPKMFALLGGLAPQYQTIYENASEVIRAELLFRPMIEDAKRNVLFSAKHVIDLKKNVKEQRKIVYEGTHLSCFAGGMFGLASKLFDTPADMEIAKRLTDGCVYAYESTVTGIMPEEFAVVPCESKQTCAWSKKKWYEALDPDMQERLDAVSLWNQNQERIYGSRGASKDRSSEEVAIQTAPNRPQATLYKGGISQDYDYTLDKRQGLDDDDLQKPSKTAVQAKEDSDEAAESLAFVPRVAVSHEKFVQARIQEERLPPGYTQIYDSEYKLRPEAIESVFIMWRLTGDDYWRQKGWMMFQSIQAATQTEIGNAAIYDVTSLLGRKKDVMESFWLAETLKYFYLLFSEPDLISLDEYILSTEAHPFKLPK